MDDTSKKITDRANEILLKLLDGIENDIQHLRSESVNLRAYEGLCRAEAARRGDAS